MQQSLSSVSKSIFEWINKLSGWILFIAIIWLCWGLARIVWLIIAPPQAPNLPILPLQTSQTQNADASNIFAIFETKQPPSSPSRPPPAVKLSGVLLAEPETLSSAMLEVNGKVANYRIDDELGDSGYFVDTVTWNEVVIVDTNNHEIVLTMPPRMVLDQSGLDAAAANNPAMNNNNNLMSDSLENSPNLLAEPTDNQGELSSNSGDAATLDNQQATGNDQQATSDPKQAIDKAVQQLKQNPAGYLSSMGVMGTGEGYEVTNAMPNKLRNKLGLEPGDKVISVNGQAVGGNPAADADLLNQIKQSGQAAIEVKRGDQTLTVRQQF